MVICWTVYCISKLSAKWLFFGAYYIKRLTCFEVSKPQFKQKWKYMILLRVIVTNVGDQGAFESIDLASRSWQQRKWNVDDQLAHSSFKKLRFRTKHKVKWWDKVLVSLHTDIIRTEGLLILSIYVQAVSFEIDHETATETTLRAVTKAKFTRIIRLCGVLYC